LELHYVLHTMLPDLLLLNDKELKASFEFETQEGEQILVKVALIFEFEFFKGAKRINEC
jgi:hypothetical protein